MWKQKLAKIDFLIIIIRIRYTILNNGSLNKKENNNNNNCSDITFIGIGHKFQSTDVSNAAPVNWWQCDAGVCAIHTSYSIQLQYCGEFFSFSEFFFCCADIAMSDCWNTMHMWARGFYVLFLIGILNQHIYHWYTYSALKKGFAKL